MVVVVWFYVLGQQGYLVAPYDTDYLASALDTMVPLCLLASFALATEQFRQTL